MGYKLRQWSKTRKNNKTALLLVFSGAAINIILAYINFVRGRNGLPVDVIQFAENPFSYAPLAPIEVIASCFIFAGFSVINIKRDFSRFAEYTFLIYLFHMGVWNVISHIFSDKLISNFPIELALIVIMSATVLCISLFLAIIYKKIACCLKRKFN